MGLDYDLFLTERGRRLEENILRSLDKLVAKGRPDTISLSNGTPNTQTFPLDGLVLKFKDGTTVELGEDEMAVAQQYGANTGMESHQKLLRELVQKLHDPPCWDKEPEEGRTTIMHTAGATDGNSQILRLILEFGDNILVEENSYYGPLIIFKSLGVTPVPVAMDGTGLIPGALKQTLSQWDAASAPGTNGKPKVLYIVPTGQNPTGATLTLDKKREIYKLAQEYNFLIVEDDPYVFLTYAEKVPSFLSLDTDGRVIRVDSFSKCLGPGFRAGYMTGPHPIMAKVGNQLGLTTHGTGPFIQNVLMGIFHRWGIDGFLKHTQSITSFYKRQMDLLVTYIDKWLEGLVEYSLPTSGMFVWVKILGCSDTQDLIFNKALANGVCAVPGVNFRPAATEGSSYIRLSFSSVSEEQMDEALRRLAKVIKEHLVKTS